MNNLLTASQIREVDAFTIKHQSISSAELMEVAARKFVELFVSIYSDKNLIISIFCGQGNNGGDGLAIGRLLHNLKYRNVLIYLVKFSSKESKDYKLNLAKISLPVIELTEASQFIPISVDVIIDAILGSGLNKPLRGEYSALSSMINTLRKPIVSVDVPTGFPSEGLIPKDYNGICADLVISFQLPKINFFFPESALALKRFELVNIGLVEEFIESLESDWKLIKSLTIPVRKRFTHKGTYGHALIVAGNEETMGAGLLCAEACLKTGAGLTTLCLPSTGLTALNTLLPEVMALPRESNLSREVFEGYTAVAIGPGLALEADNGQILERLISIGKPMVVDAGSLALLGRRRDLLDGLPKHSIITPHMKEFDRIFGSHENWWQRVITAKEQAKKRELVIVLKNEYTFVCSPSGDVHINTTGNAAMASGGMGDVLTGIIVALMAQSFPPLDAARLAVYVHGLAGDELAKYRFAINAREVAGQVPLILKKLAV
ncbi:MAG: NAD(P)H-hydrate dehydratase [Pedobacter sp.]|nr:MAG: NAD(P)H-hydrate dehydratase [Pedobacter sp.]